MWDPCYVPMAERVSFTAALPLYDAVFHTRTLAVDFLIKEGLLNLNYLNCSVGLNTIPFCIYSKYIFENIYKKIVYLSRR